MKIDTNEYNQRFEYAVEELAEKIAAELTALFAGKYIFYGRYNIFTKLDIHVIYAIDRVEVVPPGMACDDGESARYKFICGDNEFYYESNMERDAYWTRSRIVICDDIESAKAELEKWESEIPDQVKKKLR